MSIYKEVEEVRKYDTYGVEQQGREDDMKIRKHNDEEVSNTKAFRGVKEGQEALNEESQLKDGSEDESKRAMRINESSIDMDHRYT